MCNSVCNPLFNFTICEILYVVPNHDTLTRIDEVLMTIKSCSSVKFNNVFRWRLQVSSQLYIWLASLKKTLPHTSRRQILTSMLRLVDYQWNTNLTENNKKRVQHITLNFISLSLYRSTAVHQPSYYRWFHPPLFPLLLGDKCLTITIFGSSSDVWVWCSLITVLLFNIRCSVHLHCGLLHGSMVFGYSFWFCCCLAS